MGCEVPAVEQDFSAIGSQQAYHRLHQDGFSRTALPDNQVADARFQFQIDIEEDLAVAEKLIEMPDFYHFAVFYISSWVNTKLDRIIAMLLLTTALVLALPTSMAPPCTLYP